MQSPKILTEQSPPSFCPKAGCALHEFLLDCSAVDPCRPPGKVMSCTNEVSYDANVHSIPADRHLGVLQAGDVIFTVNIAYNTSLVDCSNRGSGTPGEQQNVRPAGAMVDNFRRCLSNTVSCDGHAKSQLATPIQTILLRCSTVYRTLSVSAKLIRPRISAKMRQCRARYGVWNTFNRTYLQMLP